MIAPFSAQSKTMSISVTDSASGSVALPNTGNTLRVVNTGAATAYFSVGEGSQIATVPTITPVTTATPVLPSQDVPFSIPSGSVQNISAICDSGLTTTLCLQVGEGL